MSKVFVVKGKVRKVKSIASVGISNDTGREFKAEFVADAMTDYARQCRGIQYMLKEKAQAREGK